MGREPVPAALTGLTPARREEAFALFARLRPFLEEGVPLPRLAREAGIPLRTLRRWVAGYRRDGLAGLVRRPRADRGRPRRLVPALRQLIEGLALRSPAPTAAAIHRQIRPVAEREGWPVPSYRTVAAVVQGLDPALATLAREGVKAYSGRFDLLHRHEAPHSNAIWQADHTQLDVWLLDDGGLCARLRRPLRHRHRARAASGNLAQG
ncbi:MAG: Mobile element protein [uncultured Thermomicrobiales bacterium]|uniref:Mobile element protein n=1 Tax=uncultured Thermomicrobiales bacterium TaxID=1645740 RepID=A0A6J4VVG4_9BACT|nr:MAG: Mobile element protein [uncultured Thermomicrobiales bacterium]